MVGQQTSQLTISRNNSQLTVKPLNAWNFSKFKPHEVQKMITNRLKQYSKTDFQTIRLCFMTAVSPYLLAVL